MSVVEDLQSTVEILDSYPDYAKEIVMSIADAKDLLAQLAARDAEIAAYKIRHCQPQQLGARTRCYLEWGSQRGKTGEPLRYG